MHIHTYGPATRSTGGRSREGAAQDEELEVVEQMLSELHDFQSVDGVETSDWVLQVSPVSFGG